MTTSSATDKTMMRICDIFMTPLFVGAMTNDTRKNKEVNDPPTDFSSVGGSNVLKRNCVYTRFLFLESL